MRCAAGVRVARPSGDVDVSAPIVISDAGLINTYQSLLPPEVAQKSRKFYLLILFGFVLFVLQHTLKLLSHECSLTGLIAFWSQT